MSEGQTLSPGDVLATGTPAGVGIGRKPPIYLKPGDTVAVSITGLGTLTNQIANPSIIPNPTVTQIQKVSHLRQNNAVKAADTSLLTTLNNKPLYYKQSGKPTGSPIFFIHGLGSTHDFFTPLVQTLNLDKSHSLHLLDLEGHGLSPTSPLSKLTISSFAADIDAALVHANITSGATLIAHSLGALIAVQLALTHPDKISTLILLSPPPSPLPPTERAALYAQAETVRTQGLAAVVDDIISVATSSKTKSTNPLAIAAVRISLLGQDPEGYAKACGAVAEADELDFGRLRARTLIVAGSEDGAASPELCRRYVEVLGERGSLEVVEGVGHWSVFEDLEGVAGAVGRFLSG